MNMEPKPTISASTPPEKRRAAIEKVTIDINNLGKKIEAKMAEKEKTAALIEALEERLVEERRIREKLSPAEALEKDKEENPFKYFIIQNMHDTAFSCIYSKTKKNYTLEDVNSKSAEDGREVKFYNFQNPHLTKHYTTFFSSNGFTLQLLNPKEVMDTKGRIDIGSPKARYKLVYPNWTHNAGDDEPHLVEGEKLLRKKAKKYQEDQLALFEKTRNNLI